MNPISPNSGVSPTSLAQLHRELLTSNPAGVVGNSNGSPAFPSIGSEGVVPPNQAAVGFDNMLGTFVNEVNSKQVAAGDALTGMLSGENVPLHKTMIAFGEASVSFNLMVEVRNKLLEGYQELLRMQV